MEVLCSEEDHSSYGLVITSRSEAEVVCGALSALERTATDRSRDWEDVSPVITPMLSPQQLSDLELLSKADGETDAPSVEFWGGVRLWVLGVITRYAWDHLNTGLTTSEEAVILNINEEAVTFLEDYYSKLDELDAPKVGSGAG